MPPETTADTVQNLRIDKLEATDEKHTDQLGALDGRVGILDVRFDGFDKSLERIEGSTANLGSAMSDLFIQDRAARATEKEKDRDANSLWWRQFFGLSLALVGLATTIAGAGYAATKTATAAPVAIEAPAPSPAAP